MQTLLLSQFQSRTTKRDEFTSTNENENENEKEEEEVLLNCKGGRFFTKRICFF
jgi:hypothetical protein